MRHAKQFLLVAAGALAMVVFAGREIRAEERTPMQFAVQTTASQDVPVRTAVYTQSDRENVSVDDVRSRGRRWYGGYRPYYGPRYFSYYPYYRQPAFSPYYYNPRSGFYYSTPRWTYRPYYYWR